MGKTTGDDDYLNVDAEDRSAANPAYEATFGDGTPSEKASSSTPTKWKPVAIGLGIFALVFALLFALAMAGVIGPAASSVSAVDVDDATIAASSVGGGEAAEEDQGVDTGNAISCGCDCDAMQARIDTLEYQATTSTSTTTTTSTATTTTTATLTTTSFTNTTTTTTSVTTTTTTPTNPTREVRVYNKITNSYDEGTIQSPVLQWDSSDILVGEYAKSAVEVLGHWIGRMMVPDGEYWKREDTQGNGGAIQAGWVDLIIPDEICARSEIECQALRFRNEGKFDMIGSSEALCRDVCDTQVSGKCIGYTYSANDPWSRQGYGNPGYCGIFGVDHNSERATDANRANIFTKERCKEDFAMVPGEWSTAPAPGRNNDLFNGNAAANYVTIDECEEECQQSPGALCKSYDFRLTESLTKKGTCRLFTTTGTVVRKTGQGYTHCIPQRCTTSECSTRGPKDASSLKLIFRGTRDGLFDASGPSDSNGKHDIFRKAVFGKGPYMVLIRTAAGHIFGGVMDLPFNFGTSWPDNPLENTKSGYQRTTKSFLFGLNTAINGKIPTLWPVYDANGAVEFSYNDGLFHLGGGNDFQIRADGNFNSNGKYYLNGNNELTGGQVASMGGQAEIEVFTIEAEE